MIAFPRTETAYELYQGSGVRVANAPADIDTNFVHTIHKLQKETFQENVFVYAILQIQNEPD